MSEYISWKAGDPAIAASPQIIKPKTWTTVTFGKDSLIVPKTNGTATWAYYLNVDVPADSKLLKVRFMRDPKGIADFTGLKGIDLTSYAIDSGTWIFNAKAGQPVALQVYASGTKNVTLSTREFKMWIP
jgi:hypothetical protein